jgi:DNA-binding PadR family transcriptional regulator
MADQELYSGLIRLHVLHHAAREGVFGLGMIEELRRHGYRIGPGTLYPLLHKMEAKGYLRSRQQVVAGKLRRCYAATPRGRRALEQAKARVRELFEEVFEDEAPGPAPARDRGARRGASRPDKGPGGADGLP